MSRDGKLIFNTILFLTIKELLQLTAALVSKGIFEEYQFLVVLPDKKCVVFKSDIFLLEQNIQRAAKVILNSEKKEIQTLTFRFSTSQTRWVIQSESVQFIDFMIIISNYLIPTRYVRPYLTLFYKSPSQFPINWTLGRVTRADRVDLYDSMRPDCWGDF